MPKNPRPTDGEIEEILGIAKRTALKYGAEIYEAEEVSQRTALKLINRWNTSAIKEARQRSGRGWGNYVSRVARNIYRDCIRTQERRIARERRAIGIAGEPLQERPSARRVQPRDPSGVEQYLARQAVVDAIELLTSSQQKACMRHIYLDGLSINDTSELLGLKAQTVRFHLRNARDILRERLSE